MKTCGIKLKRNVQSNKMDGLNVRKNGHIMIMALPKFSLCLSEQSLWHLGHALPWQSCIRYALFFSQNCLLSQDASSLIYLGCSPETEGRRPPAS